MIQNDLEKEQKEFSHKLFGSGDGSLIRSGIRDKIIKVIYALSTLRQLRHSAFL